MAVHYFVLSEMNSLSNEILRTTICMAKRGFVIVVLKLVHDQRIYLLQGLQYIKSRSLYAMLVGCPLYQGVSSVDTGVAYRWV